MDKIDIRAVIKYSIVKDLTLAEVKQKLDSTLNEPSPSLWRVVELKFGQISIWDVELSERPDTAASEIKIVEIFNSINRWFEVHEDAEIANILGDGLYNILDFWYKKPLDAMADAL